MKIIAFLEKKLANKSLLRSCSNENITSHHRTNITGSASKMNHNLIALHSLFSFSDLPELHINHHHFHSMESVLLPLLKITSCKLRLIA